MSKSILTVPGEGYETLYAMHRLQEAGFEFYREIVNAFEE